jgi:peptidoglycan/xylan/chitin deacetylase (PgdA/CDA1 family)
VFQIWSGDFDYLYNKMKSGVFILTLHPQVIGRGHRLLMLEKLIKYMKSHDGVTFQTMEAYAAAWKDANPFAEARLAR